MKKSPLLLLAGVFACLQGFCGPYSPTGITLLKSNLKVASADGTTTLLDGDMTQYDPSFSNAVDGMDARKLSNLYENIGMERGATCLAVERRHTIYNSDTIFYKIWNLSKQKVYQLEFDPINLSQPGLSGYVEDLYLHTKTAINLDGSGFLNFSINADAASANVYRFRLIFTAAAGGPLALSFTSLKAYRHNTAININWNTATENNLKDYTVERSYDGKTFSALAIIKANNLPANNYSWVDALPATGINYYRIMSTGMNGDVQYSEVIQLSIEKGFSLITVFPNPVINKTINLQLMNEPAGHYTITMINNFGQLIITKEAEHPGGSNTLTLSPPQSIPHGIYLLEITGADKTKTTIRVVF